MSDEESRTERRLLAGQQLLFCIGILINALLIFSHKQALTINSTVEITTTKNLPNKTAAASSIIIRSSRGNSSPLNVDENGQRWMTFIVVCGNGETDTVREMKRLLTSAILLSSVPLHFVFVTEQESSNRIQTMFEDDLAYSKKPIKVDTWILSEDSVKNFASLLNYNLASHHSGIWGTSKLMLPWILRDVDRAVQIDTDMIFLDHPAHLWNEFDSNDWLYKMPIHNRTRPSSICSCIALLKLDRIRQLNTFPTLMVEALSSKPRWNRGGLYKVPHGDQGLLWAMMLNSNAHVAPLPEQWNADRCHEYFDVLKPEEFKPASVLHNNCDFGSNNFGPAEEYFIFYDKYKWHWLKGEGAEKHAVNVTIHSEEAERLGDLFKCLKEKGE
ncbi:unnamed protein product [Cylindrotheca closterium]|uniref:Uncharacterized protein n=1 Tax=Cylindrotheca closterium TaxID=2856 RepID=A0AAD2GCB5_9STRA|nr:unnamed protein product [Cylindrotheca closterium]